MKSSQNIDDRIISGLNRVAHGLSPLFYDVGILQFEINLTMGGPAGLNTRVICKVSHKIEVSFCQVLVEWERVLSLTLVATSVLSPSTPGSGPVHLAHLSPLISCRLLHMRSRAKEGD
jgi:hypothetical protein